MFSKSLAAVMLIIALTGTSGLADYYRNFDGDTVGTLPPGWSQAYGTVAVTSSYRANCLCVGAGAYGWYDYIGTRSKGRVSYDLYLADNTWCALFLQSDTGGNKVDLYMSPSSMFSYSNGNYSYYTGGLSQGAWHHIDIDFDISANVFTLYIDSTGMGTHATDVGTGTMVRKFLAVQYGYAYPAYYDNVQYSDLPTTDAGTFTFDSDVVGTLPSGWQSAYATVAVDNTYSKSPQNCLKVYAGAYGWRDNMGYRNKGTVSYDFYLADNTWSLVCLQSDTGDNKVVLYMSPGSMFSNANGTNTYYSGGFSQGAWHHIDLDFDLPNNTFTMYLDGTSKGAHATNNGTGSMVRKFLAAQYGYNYPAYYDNVKYTAPAFVTKTYNFDSDTVGTVPIGWTVSTGTASVSNTTYYGSSPNSLRLSAYSNMECQNIGYASNGTLSFDVYLGSSNCSCVLAMMDDSEPDHDRIVLYLTPTQLFSVADGVSTYYTGSMSSGAWHHVQIDFDCTTNLFTLSLDAVNKGQHAMYTGINKYRYMAKMSVIGASNDNYVYYDNVQFTSPATSNQVTPGKYGVALKWYQGGAYYARLGMYDFQSGGTISCNYWQYTNASSKTTADGPTIGGGGSDSAYAVVGLSDFLGSNLATRTGTWTESPAGCLNITWSDNTAEQWRVTWKSATLNKIECYYLSYAASPYDLYLYVNGGWYRNASALSGGFGLGGATADFTYAKSSLDYDFTKDLNGYLCEWNGLIPSNTTSAMGIGVYSSYSITNTGVKRYQWYDSSAGLNCYNYVAIPTNSGSYNRRTIQQRSHDFNSNGNIHDDIGHIEDGLQIIDASGLARGLMYIETTPNPGGSGFNMMGSGFYFDDWSAGAQSGICPLP